MTHIRNLPHDDQAELVIISNAITNPSRMAQIWAQTASGDAMYRLSHKMLLKALHGHFSESGDLDMVTASLLVAENPRLSEVFNPSRIASITSEYGFSDIALTKALRRVNDMWRSRLLITSYDEQAIQLERGETDYRESIRAVSETTQTCLEGTSKRRDTRSIMSSGMKMLADRYEGKMPGYKIGVPAIDDILTMENGSMNLFLMQSRMGKSSLAGMIALRLHDLHDASVLWCSCEIQPEMQAVRFAVTYSTIHYPRHQWLDEHAVLGKGPRAFKSFNRVLIDCAHAIQQSRVEISETGSLNMADISAEIAQMKTDPRHAGRPLFLVVDYIQRAHGGDRSLGKYERIEQAMEILLTDICRAHGVICLVLAQVTPMPASRIRVDATHGKILPLPDPEQDILANKSIFNDFDCIISGTRPAPESDEYRSLLMLKSCKDRYGDTEGNTTLSSFNGASKTIEDWQGSIPAFDEVQRERITNINAGRGW